MTWPNITDYQDAVQNPHLCFQDPDLKTGTVVCSPPLDLPRVISGNFASVYEIRNGANRWAVRCFLRQVSNQRDRYQRLSNHLRKRKLTTLVDFKYLEQGILIRGQWYPVVKMQWVKGESLNSYIKQHLNHPETLEKMWQEWRGDVVGALRGSRLAHGDLQHGNVMVTPHGDMRLVDYDAMFVPSPSKEKSPELGHPNFQHPGRTPDFYNQDLDNFAALVIYTSIKALVVEPNLWQEFNTGENLLLSATDYKAPSQSDVLQRLKHSPDVEVQNLARMIEQCCETTVENVPDLESMADAAETTDILPAVVGATQFGTPDWLPPPPRLPPPLAPGSGGSQGGTATQQPSRSAARAAGVVVSSAGAQSGGSPGAVTGRGTSGVKLGPAKPFPKRIVLITSAVVLVLALAWVGWRFFMSSGITPANYDEITSLKPLTGHGAEVTAITFISDDETLASGSEDMSVKLWNVKTRQSQSLPTPNAAILAMALSPDGTTLAAATSDQRVILWDIATKQMKPALRGANAQINSIAFHPKDNKTLALGCEDGTVKLMDITNGSVKQPFLYHGSPVKAVAFSPDGTILASGGGSIVEGGGAAKAYIKLWEVETKQARPTLLPGHDGAVNALAFSHDGKRLASAGEDSFVILWNTQTWKQEGDKLRGHKGAVMSVAFWPGDKTLVSGGVDGIARLWDAQSLTSSPRTSLPLTGPIHSVAISPNGLLIASAGADKTITLWANK
jgi:WD40 repeat protein